MLLYTEKWSNDLESQMPKQDMTRLQYGRSSVLARFALPALYFSTRSAEPGCKTPVCPILKEGSVVPPPG